MFDDKRRYSATYYVTEWSHRQNKRASITDFKELLFQLITKTKLCVVPEQESHLFILFIWRLSCESRFFSCSFQERFVLDPHLCWLLFCTNKLEDTPHNLFCAVYRLHWSDVFSEAKKQVILSILQQTCSFPATLRAGSSNWKIDANFFFLKKKTWV